MHLLRLLADGQCHSGVYLGQALGVSRAAIWKQVSALRKKGIGIDVLPGKGYRLIEAVERWESEAVLGAMGRDAKGLLASLRIEETTSSTNDVVMEMLRVNPMGGVACIAEEQTAGRGRRGRDWFSPWGRSLYCSVGWVFTEGLAVLEGLSLAVGVAVVRAVGRLGINGVQLKWPNDLEFGGAKLGGILIEVHAEAGGHCQVIVGIGLNLALPPQAAQVLGRAVSDLTTVAGGPVARNQLGGLILEELLLLLKRYPSEGFSAVRSEWQSLDAFMGAPVVVSGLAEVIEGMAQGVDEHGALKVLTSRGLLHLQAGEVSLRKKP